MRAVRPDAGRHRSSQSVPALCNHVPGWSPAVFRRRDHNRSRSGEFCRWPADNDALIQPPPHRCWQSPGPPGRRSVVPASDPPTGPVFSAERDFHRPDRGNRQSTSPHTGAAGTAPPREPTRAARSTRSPRRDRPAEGSQRLRPHSEPTAGDRYRDRFCGPATRHNCSTPPGSGLAPQ